MEATLSGMSFTLPTTCRWSLLIETESNVRYRFELSDGTKVAQDGNQKQITEEEAGAVSRGSYSYVVDGQTITVTWTADENGFQAAGDHLPVAPAVPEYPEHVVKLLDDLRAAGVL